MSQNKKSLFIFGLLAAVSVVAGLGMKTASVSKKIDGFLLHKMEMEGTGPALVILKEQADLSGAKDILIKEERASFVYKTLTQKALKTQKDLLVFLDKNGVGYTRHYLINSIFVEKVNLEFLNELASRPDVARILPNPSIGIQEPIIQQSELKKSPNAVEPGLTFVGADRVWSEFGVKGAGIVAAGQDTGVEWNHSAMIRQYRGTKEISKDQQTSAADHNYNWHDAIHKMVVNPEGNICGYDLAVPCDDHNHGTHSLGTVVGSDGGANVIGMAPDAQWIACRNMDGGYGTPSTYIECFEFFLAPYPFGGDKMRDGDPSKAPHVMNNSWGCPESEGCYADEFVPVLNALKLAGVFVVVSAGNEGSACGTIEAPPAWHTNEALSVGATNFTTGAIAGFSSRGPSKFDGGIGPSVSAPGVNIRSATRGNTYQGGWSGTSMAGPHVAGLVALIWSANPSLIGEIDATAEIIKSTATFKAAQRSCGEDINARPNNTFGHGIINAYEAVKTALKR